MKEKHALDKAQERYDSALISYIGIEICDEKLLAIDDVVKKTQKAIL